MTAEQVRYGADVALHSKFLAIRLMTAGEDAVELAALLLDLLHQPREEASCAAPADASGLLERVSAGYNPRWERWKRLRQPKDPQGPGFDAMSAATDLANTSWFWRLLRRLDQRADVTAEALRFLALRERIRWVSQPMAVETAHAVALVGVLTDFLAFLDGRSKVVCLASYRDRRADQTQTHSKDHIEEGTHQ